MGRWIERSSTLYGKTFLATFTVVAGDPYGTNEHTPDRLEHVWVPVVSVPPLLRQSGLRKPRKGSRKLGARGCCSTRRAFSMDGRERGNKKEVMHRTDWMPAPILMLAEHWFDPPTERRTLVKVSKRHRTLRDDRPMLANTKELMLGVYKTGGVAHRRHLKVIQRKGSWRESERKESRA